MNGMDRLTSEIEDAIRQTDLFPLATSNLSGLPNVVPVKFVFVENDRELWIVDNFFNRTLQNLTQNPQAALYVYRPQPSFCCQIKGRVELRTSGDSFLRMRERVARIRSGMPARTLVVFQVEEVYSCLPPEVSFDRGKPPP